MNDINRDSHEVPDSGERKVVRGMASYFEDVQKEPLGVAELDFLMANTPPTCNYECRKCFTDASHRQPKDPLSPEEWQHMVSEAKDLGVRNVSILGEGEPLIQYHIRDTIAHIDSLGIIPMLATNARELTPEMADFLCEHNATVGFSLDTLDGDEYKDSCRGNADLVTVMRNITYARARFAQTIEHVGGFQIHRFLLHMTVTPHNFHWFKQIQEFCGDDIYFDPQPLAEVGEAEDQTEYFGAEATYEEFQRTGHQTHPPMVLAKTGEGKDTCCLFHYGLAVNHSGEVMFDTHAIEPQKFIGNVRDFPLETLLHRVRELRAYFLENFPSAGYCPVRDPAYKEFLGAISKQPPPIVWD